MKKGKWNYTEDILFDVVLIAPHAVEKPPLHWQNAFVGMARQAVRVRHGKHEFLIDNEDGSGITKIENGGGPDSFSAHLEGFDLIGEVPIQEWRTSFDKARHEADRVTVEAWQEKNFPEEFAKLQQLKAGIGEMLKGFPAHHPSPRRRR